MTEAEPSQTRAAVGSGLVRRALVGPGRKFAVVIDPHAPQSAAARVGEQVTAASVAVSSARRRARALGLPIAALGAVLCLVAAMSGDGLIRQVPAAVGHVGIGLTVLGAVVGNVVWRRGQSAASRLVVSLMARDDCRVLWLATGSDATQPVPRSMQLAAIIERSEGGTAAEVAELDALIWSYALARSTEDRIMDSDLSGAALDREMADAVALTDGIEKRLRTWQ